MGTYGFIKACSRPALHVNCPEITVLGYGRDLSLSSLLTMGYSPLHSPPKPNNITPATVASSCDDCLKRRGHLLPKKGVMQHHEFIQSPRSSLRNSSSLTRLQSKNIGLIVYRLNEPLYCQALIIPLCVHHGTPISRQRNMAFLGDGRAKRLLSPHS